MSLLAQSVDFNPIEAVWDESQQKFRAKQPISAAKFERLVVSLCF